MTPETKQFYQERIAYAEESGVAVLVSAPALREALAAVEQCEELQQNITRLETSSWMRRQAELEMDLSASRADRKLLESALAAKEAECEGLREAIRAMDTTDLWAAAHSIARRALEGQ